MQQIRDFMDKPVVKVLTGVRRSGKSALLLLIIDALMKHGIRKENIIHMNFESMHISPLNFAYTMLNQGGFLFVRIYFIIHGFWI